jgi:putative two-component system response regulator
LVLPSPPEELIIPSQLADARILIVDDQKMEVRLLESILHRGGYSNIQATTDPRGILVEVDQFPPDIVLLDLHMPHLDGFAVLKLLQSRGGEDIPVLILTGDETTESMWRSFAYGAKDFVTKPFNAAELLLRVKNLLETRSLQRQLEEQNQVLERRVEERTRDLSEAQGEILERLATAVDYKDGETGQHAHRAGALSAAIAQALGLPQDFVELLRLAAPLHDVGKIGVPDRILKKPGELEAEEFEQVKTHTTIGAAILSGSRFALLRLAEALALTHHERWDGTGYPSGLAGEKIPLAGRIVAVADVYDVLIHGRPYREAWPEVDAMEQISQQSGTDFDPSVVEAFLRMFETGTLSA